MSTTQVGQGLEAHGVQTSKPVHFNLSAAALYEHAIRRAGRPDRAGGPAGLPHRRAHRPVAERQVRRQGAVERSAASGGARSTGRSTPAQFDVAAPRHDRVPARTRSSSSRTSTPAPIRSTACRSASSTSSPGTTCSRATCSSCRRPRDLAGVPAAVHRHRRAELQGRSGASRHALRRRHRRQLRAARVLIGGTSYAGEIKKSIFTRPELPAAAAGRAVDALLGEHRRGRRHGALLRPVGHRQDDAVERSRAAADRRRRARLERSRRLQLRRRLLREDDPLSAEAEPQIYATTRRFGTVLENVVDRSGDARARSRRRVADREHARRVSDRVHRQRRAVGHGRPSDEHRHADGRRLRRAAADRAADAGRRDVSLPVRLHREGGRAPRRA